MNGGKGVAGWEWNVAAGRCFGTSVPKLRPQSRSQPFPSFIIQYFREALFPKAIPVSGKGFPDTTQSSFRNISQHRKQAKYGTLQFRRLLYSISFQGFSPRRLIQLFVNSTRLTIYHEVPGARLVIWIGGSSDVSGYDVSAYRIADNWRAYHNLACLIQAHNNTTTR